MTTRISHSFVIAGVLLLSTAHAQNPLDLQEADARDAAYALMDRVHESFACRFEEASMGELGIERFLVELNATGDDCDAAMTHLVKLADRGSGLIFRRTGNTGGTPTDAPSETRPILPPNALIHEVNPDVDAAEERAEDEAPADVPQPG